MSRRTRVLVGACCASFAWIALVTTYAHLRYLRRPSAPDAAYRETTNAVQNFGDMTGVAAIFMLAKRKLREDPDAG